MKKAYISGAITGHKREDVLKKFSSACEIVKAFGYEPLNPLHVHGIYSIDDWDKHIPLESHLDYIRDDIRFMLQKDCNTITMLEDWKSSVGARMEYEIAKIFKFEILYIIDSCLMKK